MTIYKINHLNLGQKIGLKQMITHVKYKTPIVKLNLKPIVKVKFKWCILVKGIIITAGIEADQAARQADERDKEEVFKNSAPFKDCISEVNNTRTDNKKDLVLFCQCII